MNIFFSLSLISSQRISSCSTWIIIIITIMYLDFSNRTKDDDNALIHRRRHLLLRDDLFSL